MSLEDPDYVALSHANLNVDNAYYWRDEASTFPETLVMLGHICILCLWRTNKNPRWQEVELGIQPFGSVLSPQAGKLTCGVLDWGGFGASCLGHKLWWYFNCSEFEMLKERNDSQILGFHNQ